jgi:hypothetical protein
MKAPPPPLGTPPPLDHAFALDHAIDVSVWSQRARLAANVLIQTLPSSQTPPPLQTPPDAAASVQSDGCSQTRAGRVDQATSVQSLGFGQPLAAATPRDTLGRVNIE